MDVHIHHFGDCCCIDCCDGHQRMSCNNFSNFLHRSRQFGFNSPAHCFFVEKLQDVVIPGTR